MKVLVLVVAALFADRPPPAPARRAAGVAGIDSVSGVAARR